MADAGLLVLLFAAGVAAGFVDSTVGGGGVVSLPTLLATGMPAHLALGTNKLAGTVATFTATIRYTRAGLVNQPLAMALIPLGVVASMAGSLFVLTVEPRFIRGLVILVMAVLTLYVVLRPKFGRVERPRGLTWVVLAATPMATAAIAFYDGFLGPGTGTFLVFAYVAILGFDFRGASAHARVVNLATNGGALAVFVVRKQVDYALGVPMMVGMFLGAFIGSHVGIRHGQRWIKPLFIVVSLALMTRLVLTL